MCQLKMIGLKVFKIHQIVPFMGIKGLGAENRLCVLRRKANVSLKRPLSIR